MRLNSTTRIFSFLFNSFNQEQLNVFWSGLDPLLRSETIIARDPHRHRDTHLDCHSSNTVYLSQGDSLELDMNGNTRNSVKKHGYALIVAQRQQKNRNSVVACFYSFLFSSHFETLVNLCLN